ncbi:binding-protein-dependent transport systems inner membrane component (plasmid) [Ketogulonicigenium vulgare Y25]|uniref:Dipeptide transport system permease protein n=1 Tax=Ketogulonicigenium vulgare (strain WSH-001) TaxID=759362 RepID=F9YBE9_KETVW|nr:ABC transporter permease [Ketogulonicigenium vulgare]ADO44264.1 binding-protein-dependent transport systems inner membrane component [Ketogulonicigenium vulgare Y25]AEM42701.1 Dipeptide transport system permease protein [Ketogulonicigenium vulgare WSH-001]ALJ82849.1 D-ala-D-ala transporter subunit [Ketogulonicigenium vulgare]
MQLSNITRSPGWTAFFASPMSVIGLIIVVVIVALAALANIITPYPTHVGPIGDFAAMNQAPSAAHWAGTDPMGRDQVTRIIFGFRLALIMAAVVLVTSVPVGIAVGLLAGYKGGWTEYLLMRLTDIFLAVPPLVFAMAIMGFMEPTLLNGMIAITALWWTWYARLIYSVTRAEAQEGYVLAAETIGASTFHILFREILPNCLPTIITKMTIDVGFVILMAASLSFLGLGVQPPTPDLGAMVADGAKYMPDSWWLSLFPGIAILIVVLGFNLLGDGLREAFDAGK